MRNYKDFDSLDDAKEIRKSAHEQLLIADKIKSNLSEHSRSQNKSEAEANAARGNRIFMNEKNLIYFSNSKA